jgi:hypothetical protein
VSIKLRGVVGEGDWWLTTVYGPSRDQEKAEFLTELHALWSFCLGSWLLTGDFNLIYRVKDKNNYRLDRHLMGQFYHILNDVCLKEIHLNNCLFMWSNERSHQTLERIDCTFVSREWDELFPYHDLHFLASLYSDHAPPASHGPLVCLPQAVLLLVMVAMFPWVPGSGETSMALPLPRRQPMQAA